MYAATCPFVYLLTGKMNKRGIIVIGFLVTVIGLLFIGGSQWFLFVIGNEPKFIILGLAIFGVFGGMISIPILPEMMEVYE